MLTLPGPAYPQYHLSDQRLCLIFASFPDKRKTARIRTCHSSENGSIRVPKYNSLKSPGPGVHSGLTCH